jgi:hypothetical protein
VPLPQFNNFGDLPPGLHAGELGEVLHRFGVGSTRRALLAERLRRLRQLASSTGKVSQFLVFGSFVTEKSEPNDVDVFLLMDDSFDVKTLSGETRLLFDHGTAQSHFGASVFWLRRLAALGGVDAVIDQWATKRDGSRRGIIRVIESST